VRIASHAGGEKKAQGAQEANERGQTQEREKGRQEKKGKEKEKQLLLVVAVKRQRARHTDARKTRRRRLLGG
jgi:hypothetical protein